MNTKIIAQFYKKHNCLPSQYSEQTLAVDLANGKPESHLKQLEKRGKNIITSGAWNSIKNEAHDKAFTVANVMNADIVQAIYKAVYKAKESGTPLKDFQKDLVPKLKDMGWTDVTTGRLRVVYETNMRMSHMKGKFEGMKLISDIKPYWKYLQIQRSTKDLVHAQYHNKVFRHDDSIWSVIWPPSRHGCGCTVVALASADNVEDGANWNVNINDHPISPLKTWEPDTTKYVDGIRSQLDKILENKAKVNNTKQKTKVDNENIIKDWENIKSNSDKFATYIDLHKEYYKTAPESVIKGFDDYSGSGFIYINSALRNNENMSDKHKDSYNGMLEDFKIKIKKDTVTYRGVSCESKEQINLYDSLVAGKTKQIVEKAFWSCSAKESIANEFASQSDTQIIYEILLPKNTPIGIGTFLGGYSEQEFILKPNTIFDVLDVQKKGGKKLIVKLIPKK